MLIIQKGTLWRPNSYGVLKKSLKYCSFGHYAYIIKWSWIIYLLFWAQECSQRREQLEWCELFLARPAISILASWPRGMVYIGIGLSMFELKVWRFCSVIGCFSLATDMMGLGMLEKASQKHGICNKRFKSIATLQVVSATWGKYQNLGQKFLQLNPLAADF